MSLSKPNSHPQNMKRSENPRQLVTSHTNPIACRVCDEVFFNNISLVLHFECHLQDEISSSWQNGRDLASWQSGRNLSSNLSVRSCSSVGRMDDVMLPRMSNSLGTCPLPVSSEITPKLSQTDFDLVHFPVLNSMPQINLGLDDRRSLSQSFCHSIMSHHITSKNMMLPRMNNCPRTSPLPVSSAITPKFSQTDFVLNSMPPINSALDYRMNSSQMTCYSIMNHHMSISSSSKPSIHSQCSAHGFASGASSRSIEKIGGKKRSRDHMNPCIKQSKRPIQEIIVIGDDKEDGDKDAEIDLTLKL